MQISNGVEELSLTQIKEQKEAVIASIAGGQQATKRLVDMGLTPGTRIKLLRKAFWGPLEIEVRGSRLVLGRGLAVKILVKPL
jgi:ferrous iron transport protein A